MESKQKTSFCRFELCRSLGINTAPCMYGSECHNAHTVDEIQIKPHIKAWNSVVKKDINLLQIKECVSNALKKAMGNINNPKYCSKLNYIDTLEFEELLNTWFEITCHYRKLAKELPFKKDKTTTNIKEGFHYREDVPSIELIDPTNKWTEDMIWALERTLHMCPVYYEMIDKMKYSFDSICCGGENCKLGVHDYNHIVCIDDMMTGKCECIDKDEYNVKKTQLEKIVYDKITAIEESIRILKAQLTPVDDDGFQTKLPKNSRTNISIQLNKLKQELNSIPEKIELDGMFRFTHLTEQGMIPMSQRIKEQEEVLKKLDKIEVVEVKKLSKKTYR